MMRTLILAALVLSSTVRAETGEKERRAAIKRGIAYLDAHLLRLPEVSGTPRKPFTYAVAGLCYLMDGTSRTGKNKLGPIRAYLVRYATDVAEKLKDPANLPPRHGLADSRSLIQYTWPLSVAGLFFLESEVRGQKSAHALRKVLSILADAQERNGGWGHGRINAAKSAKGAVGIAGYPSTLVSASNCVAMTLGLAEARGYDVAAPVKRARRYYRVARLTNGSFPYDPSQRSSGFAKVNAGRTAGSIFAMHCLGMPRDDAFLGSVKYLEKQWNYIPEGHGSPCLNMMHGALCANMLGDKTWKRFKKDFFPRIIKAQDEAGHCACICEEKAFGVTCDTKDRFKGKLAGFGGFFKQGKQCYTTALHTFVLLLEKDRLRLTKLRKPGGAVTPRRKKR